MLRPAGSRLCRQSTISGQVGARIGAPVITSTRNRRIVNTRKLDQRKHRERQERFLVEGLQLLHMALDAGIEPLEVFYNESQFAGDEAALLLSRFRHTSAALTEVSETVMTALCEREMPQGLVATYPLLDVSLDSLEPTDSSLVLALDRLQDPGNLGTLIRTADAVGAAAVVRITPCVDPYDLKSVRGSMGSVFNLPLVQTDDVRALFDRLSRWGIRSVGADVHQGQLWGETMLRGGVALVLGNEARGLSPDVRDYVSDCAQLPVAGKAESLNVAVAGGILMYLWLRENT